MLVSRMFNTGDDATAAVSDLRQTGFRQLAITTIDKTAAEVSKDSLIKAGVAEVRAQSYADSINEGKTLVIVAAPPGAGPTAKAILERSRASDSGDHPAEYEVSPSLATAAKPIASLSAPFSAKMNWPALLHDPAPLSNFLGWRILSDPPTKKPTSHGLPFLSDDPTPLSTRIGMKALSDNPTPFSSWIGRKTLSDNPTPFSTWLGQKVLSDNPTPLSSRFGWKVFSDNPAPLSSRFGWKVLSDNPAPLSSWLGWTVLSKDQ